MIAVAALTIAHVGQPSASAIGDLPTYRAVSRGPRRQGFLPVRMEQQKNGQTDSVFVLEHVEIDGVAKPRDKARTAGQP